MRNRITLINPIRVSNGRGGYSLKYDQGDQMEVWARVELASVNNRYRFYKHDADINRVFYIRENPFFKNDTRILFDGVLYAAGPYGPWSQNANFIEIPAGEV